MPYYGLSLIGSVLVGVLGWIAANFIARPILRAYELRECVWEELLVSANVSVLDGEHYTRSVEKPRRPRGREGSRGSEVAAGKPVDRRQRRPDRAPQQQGSPGCL